MMRRLPGMMLAVLVACALAVLTAPPAPAAQAQGEQPQGLKLAALFSDHMVLQQGLSCPVWGWTAPGTQVTVSIAGQRKQATAGEDGKWMVRLDPLKAGGPHELAVSAGGQAVTVTDVLVGEVWIASGQSNMEWPLRLSNGGPELAKSVRNDKLRLFTVQKRPADEPRKDVVGSWTQVDERSALSFSAVGFHFGLELQKALDVPVGMIHTSWGGTAIQLWQSEPALAADPDFAPMLRAHQEYVKNFPALKAKRDAEIAAAKAAGKTGRDVPQPLRAPGMGPASLYNGMVAPLVPYGIAGAIWYQGESNAGNAELYRKQMPAMIEQWRKDFGHGPFPFMMTQLANFMERDPQPSDTGWARLREAQLLTANTLPGTGMAVTIDIGEAKDIHPRNKADVGKRLALAALGIGYKRPVVYSGPIYESMAVEGSKVRVRFKHVGGGLVAKDGEALKGFAVAGEDRKFVWAEAKVDGDTVVVWSDQVERPVAVRYGWANNPEVNLYNKEGLPASPFRTDQWPPAR